MTNEKVLVVANSVYQLLTAVHMKSSILYDCEVDLLATDVMTGMEDFIPRLKDTGVFRRVLTGHTMEINKKYAGAGEEALTEGFREIPEIFRCQLSDQLDNYSQVYFANFDPFTRMLACRYYYDDCGFMWYEDGFSSYVIDYLREDRAPINRHAEGRKIRDKVRAVLLYEPHLAMRGDGLPNRALPKIQRENQDLKEKLNYIFDYHPPEKEANFIFLEQSFRAEGIKSNDLELMKECRQIVGAGKFLVKPHPRNPENLPLQMGLTRRYMVQAPWELLLLNEDAREQTVITVCSNAALTGRLVFGLDMPTVMLYRLFEGKVLWKEDAILKRYLEKFRRQFAGKNYYVPETVYELRHVLEYLGGRHD